MTMPYSRQVRPSVLMVPMLSSRRTGITKLARASPGWRVGSATLLPCIALLGMRSPRWRRCSGSARRRSEYIFMQGGDVCWR